MWTEYQHSYVIKKRVYLCKRVCEKQACEKWRNEYVKTSM